MNDLIVIGGTAFAPEDVSSLKVAEASECMGVKIPDRVVIQMKPQDDHMGMSSPGACFVHKFASPEAATVEFLRLTKLVNMARREASVPREKS